MISMAARAGQILTVWIILGVIIWVLMAGVERIANALNPTWTDIQEWTDIENPGAGSCQTPGVKPMSSES